jgi:hypothetical protein
MDIRKNAGYVITDSIHIGNAEFVIGVNEKAPAPFVTWQCKDGDNYFWGHYFTTPLAAQKDLCDRAAKEIEYLETRNQEKADGTSAVKHKSKERER